MNKIAVSLFALLAIVLIPVASHAATYAGGEEYSVRSGDVVEGNMYVGGAKVTIEGDVQGDLFVGGGDITVTGSVTEDLMAGGGSFSISGTVGEDIRVAGGDMTLSGYVGGELVAAGGYVHITSGAVIEGDVLVAGGRALIEGTINGELQVYGGEVELGGTVEGAVISESEVLSISSTAVLKNGLGYKAYEEAEVDEGAQISGEVLYEPMKSHIAASANTNLAALIAVATAFFSALWFAMLVCMLITALVLFALAKKRMKAAVRHTFKKFWPETLRGLIVAILLPIAIFISFFSVIGIGLGTLALTLFVLIAFLAKVGASILAGSLVFRLVTKKYEVNWKTIVVGVLVMSLVGLVPVIGPITCCIFFLAAFGTLWLEVYKAFAPSK